MTPNGQATDPAFAAPLLAGHLRLVGEPLCPARWYTDQEAARWLHDRALFGLLAHDTSADPFFVHANSRARERCGCSWGEFVGMPSRLSARPDGRRDRDAFARGVRADHYATGCLEIRVGKGGRPCWTEDVTRWDPMDTRGRIHGQTAVFRSWSPAAG
ncbi:MEKHLA domain-containing protein [Streptomyces olivaceoviridis]